MLWRHLTTGDHQFDQLLLSRSGPTSPLTMVVPSLSSSLHIPVTEFHRALVPRLREFHFLHCVDGSVPTTDSPQLLELPLPHLEYFSLTGSESAMSRKARTHSSLPLSGINAPRLRYLSLGLTTILPQESGFPRLTHLCLSFITAPNLHGRVTDLLRNCPALTSLILRRLQCSTRLATLDFWRPITTPEPLSPHSSSLCRVILADMDPNLVEYYAALFSRLRPCIQIPISERDPFASREREVFGSLYHQYAHGAEETDVSRLSIATHAVADHGVFGTTAGFSVTLANSTNLLRVAVWPKLLERDPYGRRNWRADVLAPLGGLAGIREVWLTDVDMIMDPTGKGPNCLGDSSVPLWNFSDPVRVDGGPDGNSKPATALPSALVNAVIIYNCSSRLRPAGPIQPTIDVLPRRPRALEHLRLAIGYDPDDLPRLRGVWSSSSSSPIPGPREGSGSTQSQGKVDLSTNLLRALRVASESDRGAYAYLKQARLLVQVMPHLVLYASELEWLREHFAAVVVEEIDRLPMMPVPERVRDGVLDGEGFIPGSVLC